MSHRVERRPAQKSKKQQRCPDCNAPTAAGNGDILRLFANLGAQSESTDVQKSNVESERIANLESLVGDLEEQLRACMKDK